MHLPTVERYSAIIEEKNSHHFSSLDQYTFSFMEKGGKKDFCFSFGTCAAVFKARKDGQDYAIRCFLKGELETFRRYEQFNAYTASKDLPWKVGFEFLDNEIQVDGQWYPVVKMDWVYGSQLHKFIDEIVFDHNKLTELQAKLVLLSHQLEEAGIGHGDLKYNNIYVVKQDFDFALKLIDYDSIFIPSFRGKKNLEPGSPGFQHPRRLATAFSETIDRFSVWVMLTALEAIKTDAHLWREAAQDEYTNSEHSLFTVMDFINPENSKLFQKLKGYNKEGLNYYVGKLIAACRERDLNFIEKPQVYKEHVHFIPQQPAPAPVVPVPAAEEKRHEVEIKTIPAGKDVLVNGIKKGITPLSLQLPAKDFDKVVVINEGERTPVLITERLNIYEIDFSPKPKEENKPVIEPDEIIEFKADKYIIQAGELATLNWKVKGDGKIHISNMGDVAEKAGTKRVVLNNTTDYILTIGSQNQSLTINVQPKPAAVPRVVPGNVKKPPLPVYTFSRKDTARPGAKDRILRIALVLIGATVAGLATFHFFFQNKSLNNKAIVTAAASNTVLNAPTEKAPLFTQSGITSFLNDLYKAYNSRDLSSIMKHYASSINEYYDSRIVTKDSLSRIIHNLFITPASYGCTPDFKTLVAQPDGQKCRVVITIHEKLKSDNNTATENYTTTIEYVIDRSYKIISEKNLG